MNDDRRDVADAFERVVHGIPHQPEFRDVEIVASTAHRQRGTTALSVMVDREGGVDMATCERVAARINVALEAFTDPYTLEVTSAGLDRPLVKPQDYERFAGRAAKIVTTLAIEGAKTHRGRLVGLRGSVAVLENGGKELPIPLELVKSANLEYDIRDDLRRAKARNKTDR